MRISDRVSDRRAVDGHDGRSGALIERGLLDGSVPVYVKTSEAATDIVGLATGDARRELRLHAEGVLGDLPDGIGSALLGVDDLGDRLVTVTRALGDTVLTWDTVLDRGRVRAVLDGIVAVHRRHQGAAPPGLCPLETRLALFAPAHARRLRPANPGLVDAVLRGQALLAEAVPADVAAAVDRCYADPGPLAAALSAGGTTLLHGDYSLPNVALDGDEVRALDWSLATEGPSAVDLVGFCVSATSNVTLDRDALLAEARRACRDLCDDDTFALCGFWALLELGWNKALDAADHPDPAGRAAGRDDLAFWVGRARSALDRGLVPVPDGSGMRPARQDCTLQ